MPKSGDQIALVLGATGGIGGETAAALSAHGWRVRALIRDPAAAQARDHDSDSWDWIGGNAMDPDAVMRAAEGARLVVHAVNPPGYRKWDRLVLPMLENTIQAARANNARVLLPGTIYNYGADAFPVLREDSPQNPSTRKGEIRAAMEARLRAASGDGVRTIILRAGDFFGPRPGNNWFSQALVKPGRPVRAVTYPGRGGVGHAWAYLPDVAETFAQLAARETEFPAFAVFNFGGYWDADGRQMIAAIGRAVGNPAIKVKPLPWTILAIAAPFNETLRELVKMKQFWRMPVRLDNARLIAFLGAEPHTSLDQAVAATLAGLGVSGRK